MNDLHTCTVTRSPRAAHWNHSLPNVGERGSVLVCSPSSEAQGPRRPGGTHSPGSFGCDALILVHSGKINIGDANFSGDLDSKLYSVCNVTVVTFNSDREVIVATGKFNILEV